MTQTENSISALDHAFAALQEALVLLEQVVQEQADKIASQPALAEATDATSGDEMQMSMAEKQAVQHELSRLKATISEATALVLDAQKNKGTS